MNEELYEKLMRLQWLLRKQQLSGWMGRGPMADTTRGQGRILAVLKMKDGVSTKDLSYLLGVRVSSLNELLAKLERGGYITREPSGQDKRVMLVKLAEKGRNEEQPEATDFGDVFGCLNEEEQHTLAAYLDRIIAALKASFGADDDAFARMEKERERMAEFFGARGDPRHGHGRFPDFHGFGGFQDWDR